MAHSPGDWEIRDNEIWVKVNDSRQAIKLAIVVPWPKVTDDNARVMAAGPDLLAMLQRSLKLHEMVSRMCFTLKNALPGETADESGIVKSDRLLMRDTIKAADKIEVEIRGLIAKTKGGA